MSRFLNILWLDSKSCNDRYVMQDVHNALCQSEPQQWSAHLDFGVDDQAALSLANQRVLNRQSPHVTH